MAAIAAIANLVHQTATTTGTGNFTLATVSGKQSFNTAFGNGAATDIFFYFISNETASEYEWGTGHMSSSTVLVRDTVLGGTNGTSAVNFSAGTKDVTNDAPALSRRVKLTADITYYVRTDGSDGNTGLVNSAAGAFLTIQKAVDTVASIDISIYNVTMQVVNTSSPSTFTGGIVVNGPWIGGGTVSLVGDTTTPTNVVISTTSADCIKLKNKARLSVRGFKLQTTTSGDCCLVDSGSSLLIDGLVDFGVVAGNHMESQSGSYIETTTNYTISGSAAAGYHLVTADAGVIRIGSQTVTLSGTPAFATYALSTRNADILSSATYSGSGTGPRYNSDSNSSINTFTGDPTKLPGNVVGSCNKGGIYS